MDEDDIPFTVWFSGNDDRIHVQLERTSFDLRDAVFLLHNLEQAINDYEGHVGR